MDGGNNASQKGQRKVSLALLTFFLLLVVNDYLALLFSLLNPTENLLNQGHGLRSCNR